jgi:glycyl-tRNA synthetase
MERVIGLARRRGFIFPSSEIYGGFANAYDYGPLGVELLRRVKDSWWAATVRRAHSLPGDDRASRTRVVGLDSAIIQSPRVWEASGHAAGFSDPMVDCRSCKARFRLDDDDDASSASDAACCPECGGSDLTGQREFNLMFKTQIGALDASDGEEGAGRSAYLRPETAQGIFLSYKAVADSMRLAPPFGVAQLGKSFRNEITPGRFVFRTREFEQAELEFFCRDAAAAQEWHAYWVAARFDWYVETLGLARDRLRLREQGPAELAHYSVRCTDIEYEFPWGWGELEGVAIRGDYDLAKHADASGVDLRVLDPHSGERYLPHVVEPAAGIGRIALAMLVDASIRGVERAAEDEREVLALRARFAPTTVAVLPLLKKPASGLPAMAHAIEDVLRAACGDAWPTHAEPSPLVRDALLGAEDAGAARRPARFRAGFEPTLAYDHTGAIGRRYRRYDEIGTPLCVTIDHATLADEANRVVTVRSRDSMAQHSVHLRDLVDFLADAIDDADR